MQYSNALEFATSMVGFYIVDMETVQSRLNALFREANSPTDQHVADNSDLSQATIHRIRHGNTQEPSMRSIKKLALYFRVNVEWLANGIGPKRGANKSEISPSAEEFLKDFEYLPDVFKSYLLRKARGLRKISDEMQPIVRKSLSSPNDPERYKEWERGMDDLLHEKADEE